MSQVNTKTYTTNVSLQVRGTNTELAFLPADFPPVLPITFYTSATVRLSPILADISTSGFSVRQGDWNKSEAHSSASISYIIGSTVNSFAEDALVSKHNKFLHVTDFRYPDWIPDPDQFITNGVLYVNDPNSITGQDNFTNPGTYTWVCPVGVTSICVVAVGSGGSGGYQWSSGGGGGGGLGWKNNIPVTPGQSYTVIVGAPGPSQTTNATNAAAMGNSSYFDSESVVCGFGAGRGGTDATGSGNGGYGGGYTGDGGGRGGNGGYQGSWNWAGGGAGGYSGKGGDGGQSSGSGQAGQGGGGGAGGWYSSTWGTPGGGGVGILGEGASGGTVSSTGQGGKGGSGGTDGAPGEPLSNGASRGTRTGGVYGGGGGGSGTSAGGGPGGKGAVRIIYGIGRAYPSTNTADATGGGGYVPGTFSSSISNIFGTADPTTVAPTINVDIGASRIKVSSGIIAENSYGIANTSINTRDYTRAEEEKVVGSSGIIKVSRDIGAFNPSYSKAVTIPINVTDLSVTIGVFENNGITTFATITDENNPTLLDVVYVEVDNGNGGEVVVSGPAQYWS